MSKKLLSSILREIVVDENTGCHDNACMIMRSKVSQSDDIRRIEYIIYPEPRVLIIGYHIFRQMRQKLSVFSASGHRLLSLPPSLCLSLTLYRHFDRLVSPLSRSSCHLLPLFNASSSSCASHATRSECECVSTLFYIDRPPV